jgi:hypothetical protein
VEPDKACCKRYKKGRADADEGGSSGNSDLPERLGRDDISAGMGSVRSRVKACGAKANFTGKVSVKMKIGGDGRVQSVSADGGPSDVRSCVAAAVKSAKFKRTQKGLTVNYPFIL